ncbi:MAG: hypothetical protein MJ102_05225 [Clostridia bacterium]|nr:hypothetical protein [Clostridia bacterium]
MKFIKSAKHFTSLLLTVLMVVSLVVPAFAYQSAFKSTAAVTEFSQEAIDKVAGFEDGDNIFAMGEYDTDEYTTPLSYCESGLCQFNYQHNDGKWGRAIKDTAWSINGMAAVGDGNIDAALSSSPSGAMWFSRTTTGTKRVDANGTVTANGKYFTLAGWEFAADFAVKGFRIYFHADAIADDFDLLVGHLEGDEIVWEIAYCGNDITDETVAAEDCENDIVYFEADFCQTMEGRFIQIAAKSTDGMDTTKKSGHSGYFCTELEVYYGEVEGVNHTVSMVDSTATCTEAGLAAHYECEFCGKCFSDADGENEITADDIETVPALGHDYVGGECTRCHIGGGVITDAEGFLAMDPAGSYELANDITLDESYASTFTGSFDGKGHTIINSVPVFTGLGGSAVVKDLILGGDGTAKTIVDKDGSRSASSTFRGSLANQIVNSGSASSVTIENVINYTNLDVDCRVGGLIAMISSSETLEVNTVITNCKNYGDISGTNIAGGIVGYSQRKTLKLTDCENYGDITCSNNVAGGIIARFGMDNVYAAQYCITIVDCNNYGEINGGSNSGGILGLLVGAKADISGCINEGNVTVTGENAAGILGSTTSKKDYKSHVIIDRCYNAADILSEKKNAAGIIGYAYGSGSDNYLVLTNSTNTGIIMGAAYVSQLAAYVNSKSTTIKNCVAGGYLEPYSEGAFLCFIGSSNQIATNYKISNVYYLENDGIEWFGYSATEANQTAWENRIGIILSTQDDMYFGKIAVELNEAIGETVFYENVNLDPLDLAPIPNDRSRYVYPLVDGTYSNYLARIDRTIISLESGETFRMHFYADITADLIDKFETIQLSIIAHGEETLIDTDRSWRTGDRHDSPATFSDFVITPQCISDDMTIILYVDGVEYDRVEHYSARQYFLYQMECTPVGSTLHTLCADILEYGAAVQIYRGYNLEHLANEGVTDQTEFVPLTSSSSKKFTANSEYNGTSRILAAGVDFDFDNSIFVRFSTDDFANFGITVGTDLNGEWYEEEQDLEFWLSRGEVYPYGGNCYRFNIWSVRACDLTNMFTIRFEDNGTWVGTLEYSLAAYVYALQNNPNEKVANLVKALYNYGLSADAYTN